ncbi:dihydrofolate reductase [Aestuariirhabdus sp. Z084]|uniref:dihydrofolate reductase n=1 Tax=Aestuariirhabdus haliotis TaxID=2918751 RepID=UPI00201B3629|nr:dihydrofolate reductase [Aestuariirhabdus haliotis]MCL6417448.1 dihydrofolate reductase [Aestuariirhabdus haliotis]MCL6421400.1 dihydrofolate reductase [Aestuariirhabdus haliotis]
MRIAMIAAVAENGAIGIDNKLPWYLPGDLRYFKAVTMGKPIIMGRKTFDSLRKPLPGRTNIVITRDSNYQPEGVKVVHSLDAALSLAEEVGLINGLDEMMIIGGEQIYRLAMERADRLYLTRVYQSFEGDAWFPELDQTCWSESQREDHFSEDEPPLKYSYQVLDRVQ